jgi:hypothetical protein
MKSMIIWWRNTFICFSQHVSPRTLPNPIQLLGAYEAIVRKHILKCQKKWKINFACTSSYSIFAHKFSRKMNIFMSLIKKANFDVSIWLFMGYFLSFYRGHIKCLFLQKTVYEHRMSGSTCGIYYYIFLHLFSGFFIIGSYKPRSQNTTS